LLAYVLDDKVPVRPDAPDVGARLLKYLSCDGFFRGGPVVMLEEGDHVVTMEYREPMFATYARWRFRRLFRVVGVGMDPDDYHFELELQALLEATTHQDELLREHNWLAQPTAWFQPVPREVWRWLIEAKGMPLPPVPPPGEDAPTGEKEAWDVARYIAAYDACAHQRGGWRFEPADVELEELRREYAAGAYATLAEYACSRFEYEQRT
jgi:hypothetical protein